MGIDVVFFSEDKDRYAHLNKNPWGLTESVIVKSSYDDKSLINICKKHNVNFIIAPGDYQLEVSAKVNEALDGYGPSLKSVNYCKNKNTTRDKISFAKNTVNYLTVNNISEIKNWSIYPAIVKPINGSGSVNVNKVNSYADIQEVAS